MPGHGEGRARSESLCAIGQPAAFECTTRRELGLLEGGLLLPSQPPCWLPVWAISAGVTEETGLGSLQEAQRSVQSRALVF